MRFKYLLTRLKLESYTIKPISQIKTYYLHISKKKTKFAAQ